MKNKVYILFLKIALLFSPLALLLASYIYYDPWKIIFKYGDYYKDCFVDLNRDYIGTEVFLKNKDKLNYNAFIFGNSRSRSFICDDWLKYIPGTSPLHYDASSETLTGIAAKIKLIDEHKCPLDHALLVIDGSVLWRAKFRHGPVFESHPAESRSHLVNFHSVFFKYYLSGFYFVQFMDYYYTHQQRPYMSALQFDPMTYNTATNDIYWGEFEKEMQKDPEAFIKKRSKLYSPRDTLKTIYSPEFIGDYQVNTFSEIKRIFTEKHTGYKVIISPLYNQEYINREDLSKLDSIFGKENVYDFSGRNEYTRDIENYFESSHYRRRVAQDILKKIYENRN